MPAPGRIFQAIFFKGPVKLFFNREVTQNNHLVFFGFRLQKFEIVFTYAFVLAWPATFFSAKQITFFRMYRLLAGASPTAFGP